MSNEVIVIILTGVAILAILLSLLIMDDKPDNNITSEFKIKKKHNFYKEDNWL